MYNEFSFQNLMHKVRVMEKSSRQRITNDNNASIQMNKLDVRSRELVLENK